MNKIFNGVSVVGIIEPGQLYIIADSPDRGTSPEPINYLYCIREEREILEAMDMEFCIVQAETYEAKQFLGFRKVNRNCHEFKVLCIEKDGGKKVQMKFYLHRLLSFEENLLAMRKLFGSKDIRPTRARGVEE